MLSINEIQIGKRLRGLREAAVTELMESINRLGLRTPITVSSRPAKREGGGMDTVAFDLVAGQHRLEACKRLGWEEIETSIVQMSDQFPVVARIGERERVFLPIGQVNGQQIIARRLRFRDRIRARPQRTKVVRPICARGHGNRIDHADSRSQGITHCDVGRPQTRARVGRS